MANEVESLTLELLRAIRADVAGTKTDISELRAEMRSLRADVASDMLVMQAKLEGDIARLRKETGEQINGLRRTVMTYHSAVIGHGMLINEQEDRIRRIEQHLNLPEYSAH